MNHTPPIDYERIVQEMYEAVLSSGSIAVDIGAHLGRHTLPMAQIVAPRGKVYAVEPLARCRDELIRTLDSNHIGCVTILPQALSDKPGQGELIVAEQYPPFSGLKAVPYPGPTDTHTSPVEIETFDNLFFDLPSLSYVKLDAEGAELHILRGAVKSLEKFRPVVGFEFGAWSNRAYGVAPGDMARFWIERHYNIYAITGTKLTELDFIDSSEKRHIWDYVVVPQENARLNQIIGDTLNRPRPNWLAARAELNHATDHCEVGTTVPPLRRIRGPLWPIARAAIWFFLLAARVITIPQRIVNQSMINSMSSLINDLEKAEEENWRRDRYIRQLEERIEKLEGGQMSESYFYEESKNIRTQSRAR